MREDKGIYLRGSVLHSDGYKHRSSNTSQSLFYKAGLVQENHKVYVTGFFGHQENEMAWIGVSDSLIQQDPQTNANSAEDDQFTQGLVQLQHVWVSSRQSTLRTSVYYNYLDGNYDFDLNNFLGLTSTDELYNYALESHFVGGFVNHSHRVNNWKFVTGVHINDYRREHVGTEATIGKLYANEGSRRSYSLFERLRFRKDRFIAYGDLQWRYTSFDYEGSVQMDPLDWYFFNPKIGITYELSDPIDVYVSVGRTGREPTRNDLFNGWDDLQADTLGRADMNITDPEEVADVEIGVRVHKDKVDASINLYFMSFNNEIVLNGQLGPNGLALHSNVSKSYRRGVEVDLTCQVLGDLVLANSSSWNTSQITEQGVQFAPILTPDLLINQSVLYTPRNWQFALAGRYQGSSYIGFSNIHSVDSHVLLDASVGHKWRDFSVSVRVNNLTDTQDYSSGYVEQDGTERYFVQAPVNVFSSVTWSLK